MTVMCAPDFHIFSSEVVRPEGAASEVEIRRIKQNSKAELEKEDKVIMRDQKAVDEGMERLAKEYKEVFRVIDPDQSHKLNLDEWVDFMTSTDAGLNCRHHGSSGRATYVRPTFQKMPLPRAAKYHGAKLSSGCSNATRITSTHS